MFHNKQLLFSIKLKGESLPVRHYSFHADSHTLKPLESNPAEQLRCQNCRHITLKKKNSYNVFSSHLVLIKFKPCPRLLPTGEPQRYLAETQQIVCESTRGSERSNKKVRL